MQHCTDWNKNTQHHTLSGAWKAYGMDIYKNYSCDAWCANNDWVKHQSGSGWLIACGEGYHDGTGVARKVDRNVY